MDIDATAALRHLIDLLVAYGLAYPIGWDREKQARTAGVRTFPSWRWPPAATC